MVQIRWLGELGITHKWLFISFFASNNVDMDFSRQVAWTADRAAKHVDQGGGKRNGSFTIYLEPWHADIEMFLQSRKNLGEEELKAHDLFYGL